MFISQDVKNLCQDMIDNYDKWESTRHTFKKGNTVLWVCNSFSYVDFYPNIDAFNVFEKIKIYTTVKKSKFLKVMNEYYKNS